MDELKKIYNKDIKSYKKYLKEKKNNYKSNTILPLPSKSNN